MIREANFHCQRWILFCLMGLLSLIAKPLIAEEASQSVLVDAPFMNLHTGPGRGYPVFHVAEKGEAVRILFERGGWVKVVLIDSKRGSQAPIEGWVSVTELEAAAKQPGVSEYTAEPTEPELGASVLAGQLDQAPSATLRARWQFSQTFSAAMNLNQTLGEFSELRVGTLLLMHDVFKDGLPASLPLQPYVLAGGGVVEIAPKTTLAEDKKRREDLITYGAGIRCALTRNYQVMFEYQTLLIFTERDNNEDANQWSIGLEIKL